MDTLWPNAPLVYRLGICPVPFPSNTQGLHKASLEGDQHLGMPYLFPSLPFLGLGLPLLLSVIRELLMAVWTISSKRQQGSAAVAVVTLS